MKIKVLFPKNDTIINKWKINMSIQKQCTTNSKTIANICVACEPIEKTKKTLVLRWNLWKTQRNTQVLRGGPI